MDEALRAILREIAREAPEIAELLEQMLRNGGISEQMKRKLAQSIVELARGSPIADKIMRALAMILRILGLPQPSLLPGGAVVGGAAAEGTATAGAAEAGGAAAGGAGMTIAAALFMLLAIGVLTWRVYRELTAEIDVGTASGPPCSASRTGEIMALMPRELVTSAWTGRVDSLQAAIDEAWTEAIRMRGNCDGKCPPGRECMPVVAIQDVEQWSTFPYNTTYTRLLYTLPCFCVLPDAWWAQFKWAMLPDDVKALWERLGLDEDGWEEGPKDRKPWHKLGRKEREAAEALGYDEESWSPAPQAEQRAGKKVKRKER